jgi:hypothetical protein
MHELNRLEDPLELPEQTCIESTTEHMELNDQLEDPANNLKELTCYGSAHESLRSEVVQPEVDPSHLETVNEDELLFQWLMQPKPQELKIGEEIGKGGQAHGSLGKYYSGQNIEPDPVVVRRYKTGHGIDAVQLKRQMAAVKRNSPFGLCSMHGVLEDKTKGELSVLMEVYRGDLRNLMDLKMDYLKKKDGHAQEEMEMMMPFKYNLTLDTMRDIACGMNTFAPDQWSDTQRPEGIQHPCGVLCYRLLLAVCGNRKPARDVEWEQYFISA